MKWFGRGIRGPLGWLNTDGFIQHERLFQRKDQRVPIREQDDGDNTSWLPNTEAEGGEEGHRGGDGGGQTHSKQRETKPTNTLAFSCICNQRGRASLCSCVFKNMIIKLYPLLFYFRYFCSITFITKIVSSLLKKLAVHRVLYPRIFWESWEEGKGVVKTDAKVTQKGHSWARVKVKSFLPESMRERTELLLSGPVLFSEENNFSITFENHGAKLWKKDFNVLSPV